MRPPLSYCPLLPVVTALTAGIIIDRYIPTATAVPIGLIAGSIIYLTLRRVYPAVIIATIGLGIICNQVHTPRTTIPPGERHTATVVSVSEALMSNRVIADIAGYGECYLTIPTRFSVPEEGDIIEFTAKLTAPAQRVDIDTEIRLDNFFYRNYITSAGVVGSCTIIGRSLSLRWKAARLRARLTEIIVSSGINDNAKEFLTALLLGDRSLMPECVSSTMAQAGLAHILALSGLHVAIIAFILSLLLFPLTWGEIDKPRFIVIIALLWVYAYITGLSPSVTRAVLMVTIALVGKMLGRSGTTLNSLCLAALILIVANPRIIYAPGFQLTVAAVAGICLIPKLFPTVNFTSTAKRMVVYWLIFSLSAVVSTALLSVYYFHSFPVYFLLANIPAALVLPILLGAGLLLLAIGAVGLEWSLLDKAIDLMCDAILKTADFASTLPAGSIDHIYISARTVIAGYALLIAIAATIYYREKWLAALGGAAFCVLIGFAFSDRRTPELFIARNSQATTIVIADRSGIKAKTTFPALGSDDFMKSLPQFYPNFFNMHGFDRAEAIASTDSGSHWKSSGRIIATPKVTIALIDSNEDVRSYNGHIDYAIVGRGYKGVMSQIIECLSPDSILLGSDVHSGRLKKFTFELEQISQPYRSLREGYGLHLTL